MKCPNCSAENLDNADFCSLCNIKFGKQSKTESNQQIQSDENLRDKRYISENKSKKISIFGIISFVLSLMVLFPTGFISIYSLGVKGILLFTKATDPFMTSEVGSLSKALYTGSLLVISLVFVSSLAAIVLGVKGVKKQRRDVLSKIGLVLGLFELLIMIFISIFLVKSSFAPKPRVIGSYKIIYDKQLRANFKIPSNWKKRLESDTKRYDIFYISPKYGISFATLRFYKSDGFMGKQLDTSITGYLMKRLISNEPSLSFNFQKMIEIDGEKAYWFRYTADWKYETKNSKLYNVKHVRESLVFVMRNSYYQIDLDYFGYESNFKFYLPAFLEVKKSLKFD